VSVTGARDRGALVSPKQPLREGGPPAAMRPALPNVRRRLLTVVPAFGLTTVAVLLLAPTVGSTPISLTRAFDPGIPWADNVDAQIFFIARLPRVLAGGLVGATLAAAGVVLQALLRNPLATPFTLGVSSGAALGAMLAIAWNLDVTALGVSSVPLASFTGAVIATAIVYFLATSQRRGISTNVLLLAGVTLNAFFSALITFVQYMVDSADWFRTARWLLGNLDVGSYTPILAALPLIAIAFVAFAFLPRALNLITVGDDIAAARGVDVSRAQRLAFLSTSLATGAAVSMAGPIGFIGIVVPHLVRLIVGSDHRIVLPASALFGAAFLVLCDLVARTIMAPIELPVGVVTAMIGGPFFLWLLVTKS
jgi:iron complex transport system permease protein